MQDDLLAPLVESAAVHMMHVVSLDPLNDTHVMVNSPWHGPGRAPDSAVFPWAP